MKRHGSKFEYEEERNRDLQKVYRDVMDLSDGTITQTEIYRMVVMHPAKRFWVSEERAVQVVSMMSRHYRTTLHKMYPLKRKMYKEIYRRVKEMMKDNPGMKRMDAVELVVASPAPEFYLTPGSAKVILCKARKVWYLQRKRKLRHLF